jgi:hypothetical protein
LEEKSLLRTWDNPPMTHVREQLEFSTLGDSLREFVISMDTAQVRCADSKAARNIEVVVTRCGRGGRTSIL